MDQIRIENDRYFFGAFNSQNDIDPRTGKAGIARYHLPKNGFLRFFARLFQRYVVFENGQNSYCLNRRSFQKWASRHQNPCHYLSFIKLLKRDNTDETKLDFIENVINGVVFNILFSEDKFYSLKVTDLSRGQCKRLIKPDSPIQLLKMRPNVLVFLLNTVKEKARDMFDRLSQEQIEVLDYSELERSTLEVLFNQEGAEVRVKKIPTPQVFAVYSQMSESLTKKFYSILSQDQKEALCQRLSRTEIERLEGVLPRAVDPNPATRKDPVHEMREVAKVEAKKPPPHAAAYRGPPPSGPGVLTGLALLYLVRKRS